MKKFLFLIAVMLVAVAATAQTPTATLSHAGNVKCFYGKEALVDAVAEAENGDNITLSSGLFSGTTIDKAITVKGAGMSPDTINNITPTTISSALTINTSDVTVEGTYISADLTMYHFNNIKIIACAVKGKVNNYKNTSDMGGVVNKYFIGSKALGTYNGSNANFDVKCDSINFYITNSIANVYNTSYYSSAGGSGYNDYKANHIVATNSIISLSTSGFIHNSSFTNCIIFFTGTSSSTSRYLNGSNYAYYCVGIGNTNIFKNVMGMTNAIVDNFSDVFKSFDGSNYSEYENYELTTSAATTYLGDDDTQVGMYGGSMPFNPKPNNPYITKLTVAEKSTPQGTLSVDIQVQPAQ